MEQREAYNQFHGEHPAEDSARFKEKNMVHGCMCDVALTGYGCAWVFSLKNNMEASLQIFPAPQSFVENPHARACYLFVRTFLCGCGGVCRNPLLTAACMHVLSTYLCADCCMSRRLSTFALQPRQSSHPPTSREELPATIHTHPLRTCWGEDRFCTKSFLVDDRLTKPARCPHQRSNTQ